MRILQIAPLWERVPPPAYGGTEAVVYDLTEGLIRRGHEVVVFAAGNSRTSAQLKSVFPQPLRAVFDQLKAPEFTLWAHLGAALREAQIGSYDVVHNHAGEMTLAFSSLVPTPMLTTFHGPANPELSTLWAHYAGYYNTISHASRRGYPNSGFAGVVYNGIDVASFPFRQEKDDYLLFLSRISPEKGPLEAIEVAKRTGKRLIMAGKVDRVDREFHRTQVEPLIDGQQIVFLGEADAKLKRKLYSRASCLLMPLNWEEPFGLVMTEAMACGTPVIAFARGSAPELIHDGETGFLVKNVAEMAEAVRRIGLIDPQRCRDHVVSNFSADRMAEGYLALYHKILGPRSDEAPIRLVA